MRTQAFVSALALTAVLLSACGAPAEQAASDNTGAGNTPAEAAQARQAFVRSCTEAATGEDGSTPPETFAEICGCTFDETAAQYGSQTAWLQALADYDSGKDGDGLESKMHEAGNRCAERLPAK